MTQRELQTGSAGIGVEKLLGELELEIMQVVWARQRVTVRDVLEVLTEKRPLAYTTVMTVMTRLVDKGVLRQHRQERAYAYEAVYTPEELTTKAVGQSIRSLLERFGPLAVTEFVHQIGQVDPEQLQRLAQLAQEAAEDEPL
jgi:predicted transcriptional regulator